jgi:small-conductance mechanosensitive channel
MFAAFSLNINITYYSLLNDSFIDYLKQKEEINLEIKKRFKTARLEMAFPTQQLIVKNEK